MIKPLVTLAIAATMSLTIQQPVKAQVPPGVGEGWAGEFDHAARHLVQLAEATPAEKFSWRPSPGFRTIAEVYIHLGIANYFLLGQAGVKPTFDLTTLGKDPEKSKTTKADVVAFLKGSLDAVRQGYASADRQKKVQLFKKDVTAENVFVRILVHNHEHMGQSIAYARVNGVVPPWSKGGGTQ